MAALKNIAIIIPAFNEEKVICRTLQSLSAEMDRRDIYVMSDASTDNTDRICRESGVRLARNRIRAGKVANLKKALEKFFILARYRYVMFLDADTIPAPGFFAKCLAIFSRPDVACVCGQVESEQKSNLWVCYRMLMYWVWQNVYKRLLSRVGAVTIAPGTASVYRSEVLARLEFDTRLIIEDFDLTFQVHRKHLGRIVFEPGARVITQDPDSLGETFRQAARWKTGFLQSVIKHRVPLKMRRLDWVLFLLELQEAGHLVVLTVVLPLYLWLLFGALYPSVFGIYIYKDWLMWMLLVEMGWLWMAFSLWCLIKRRWSLAWFGPGLWLVQYVYVAAYFFSVLRLFLGPVSGGWRSPARR